MPMHLQIGMSLPLIRLTYNDERYHPMITIRPYEFKPIPPDVRATLDAGADLSHTDASRVFFGPAEWPSAPTYRAQICAGQTSPAQIYRAQTSPAQTSPAQISAAQICPAQICGGRISPAQICGGQTSPAQICGGQTSPTQIYQAPTSA